MDDGPFCEISYTAGDNSVRKGRPGWTVQQGARGDVLKRVLRENLGSGDQPKTNQQIHN